MGQTVTEEEEEELEGLVVAPREVTEKRQILQAQMLLMLVVATQEVELLGQGKTKLVEVVTSHLVLVKMGCL